MFKFALVFSLFVVLAMADRDQQWKQFKSKHKKNFKDQTEEIRKRKNWENNLDKIAKHNEAYQRGEVSYSQGENEYSDWDPEDVIKKLAGFIPPKNPTTGTIYEAPRLSSLGAALPISKDYRTTGHLTGVKNQGFCGSCWAFSATGAIEAQLVMKKRPLVSLSEQHFVDCVTANWGCNGGWMDTAFEYAKIKGVEKDINYGYLGVQGTCKYNSAYVGARVNSIKKIIAGNDTDLMAAVAYLGPVSIAMHVTEAFTAYSRGIFADNTCIKNKPNHAMLVVGYGTDTATGIPYWIVKNSWGTTWGESGYIRIARKIANTDNTCGISGYASIPTIL